jgi:hypothetical protein
MKVISTPRHGLERTIVVVCQHVHDRGQSLDKLGRMGYTEAGEAGESLKRRLLQQDNGFLILPSM